MTSPFYAKRPLGRNLWIRLTILSLVSWPSIIPGTKEIIPNTRQISRIMVQMRSKTIVYK